MGGFDDVCRKRLKNNASESKTLRIESCGLVKVLGIKVRMVLIR